MKRHAVVANATSREQVAAYLPANYEVLSSFVDESDGKTRWLIGGEDVAGWTLDGYVIPRMASGLLWCSERQMIAVCPDCKQGEISTASECSVCGLHWDDVAAAAEKWKEIDRGAA